MRRRASRAELPFSRIISTRRPGAGSGSTQGGIIAYSLALSPRVATLGKFDLVPADWHQPLRQRMALLKNAGATAERFFAFAGSPAARSIMRRYGFVLPGEES